MGTRPVHIDDRQASIVDIGRDQKLARRVPDQPCGAGAGSDLAGYLAFVLRPAHHDVVADLAIHPRNGVILSHEYPVLAPKQGIIDVPILRLALFRRLEGPGIKRLKKRTRPRITPEALAGGIKQAGPAQRQDMNNPIRAQFDDRAGL